MRAAIREACGGGLAGFMALWVVVALVSGQKH
jgi:hypothetical protein